MTGADPATKHKVRLETRARTFPRTENCAPECCPGRYSLLGANQSVDVDAVAVTAVRGEVAVAGAQAREQGCVRIERIEIVGATTAAQIEEIAARSNIAGVYEGAKLGSVAGIVQSEARSGLDQQGIQIAVRFLKIA